MRKLFSRRKTRLTITVLHDGSKVWHRGLQVHREDGPAVEGPDGTKWWYLNDRLHREDGPAIVRANGTKEWRLNGQYYTMTGWLCEVLKDRPLTNPQRDLLHALSENWDGTPDSLYETVLALSAPLL